MILPYIFRSLGEKTKTLPMFMNSEKAFICLFVNAHFHLLKENVYSHYKIPFPGPRALCMCQYSNWFGLIFFIFVELGLSGGKVVFDLVLTPQEEKTFGGWGGFELNQNVQLWF